jgi:hypothetical protein
MNEQVWHFPLVLGKMPDLSNILIRFSRVLRPYRTRCCKNTAICFITQRVMPRDYVRKTDRASWSEENLAAQEVKSGKRASWNA